MSRTTSSARRRSQLRLANFLLLAMSVLLPQNSLALASPFPASKRPKVKVKTSSSGSESSNTSDPSSWSWSNPTTGSGSGSVNAQDGGEEGDVDPDAGAPNPLLDYESALVRDNGLLYSGIWVRNPTVFNGACLLWADDRVTPLPYWKPTCAAPKLKPVVWGAALAVLVLLLVCCCCCVRAAARAGVGIGKYVLAKVSGAGGNSAGRTETETAERVVGDKPVAAPAVPMQQLPSHEVNTPAQQQPLPKVYPPQSAAQAYYYPAQQYPGGSQHPVQGQQQQQQTMYPPQGSH
ncbi:hypothetical protein BCR44DRAFT_52605 [Catenaria anguillulae PL171]|uniref:Uncharacterized protein n=1 Tax=Catenaria anguillulae PL171 TaxID=765915 RepID=A0A1Y2H950_9FUNG|nr:hypothetical protein BCR44DRAFT_52605 [Catenaria anguillulae PL171]